MSLQLIDAIQSTHKADTAFMELLGLTPAVTSADMVKRFTKGVEPETTVTRETMPHICQYIMPGQFARNHLVFQGKFCIDFYGKTGYEAKLLFQRSFELFHDKRIVQPKFHSFLCVLAYDGDFATGISGVKGYKGIYDVDYLRMTEVITAMEHPEEKKEEASELEKLVKEKIRLSKKLGLMGEDVDPIEGYKEKAEYSRIREIDTRLWELVK